jgi:Tol biopolymer transport system component
MSIRSRYRWIRNAGIVALVLGLGSLMWLLGARREVMGMLSPDGRTVAFVREEASLDPPNQSLWIGPAAGRSPIRVGRLAEDQDWCDQIVWSADGRRVGFVVRGVRLDLYDVAGRRPAGSVPLLAPDGYPGSREARRVSLSPDGATVRFDECARGRALCYGERVVAIGS